MLSRLREWWRRGAPLRPERAQDYVDGIIGGEYAHLGKQGAWVDRWHLLRRETGLVEAVCQHGVGHPTPGSIAVMNAFGPPGARGSWGVHSCDSCCKTMPEVLQNVTDIGPPRNAIGAPPRTPPSPPPRSPRGAGSHLPVSRMTGELPAAIRKPTRKKRKVGTAAPRSRNRPRKGRGLSAQSSPKGKQSRSRKRYVRLEVKPWPFPTADELNREFAAAGYPRDAAPSPLKPQHDLDVPRPYERWLQQNPPSF